MDDKIKCTQNTTSVLEEGLETLEGTIARVISQTEEIISIVWGNVPIKDEDKPIELTVSGRIMDCNSKLSTASNALYEISTLLKRQLGNLTLE
jgi:hypothetical protein